MWSLKMNKHVFYWLSCRRQFKNCYAHEITCSLNLLNFYYNILMISLILGRSDKCDLTAVEALCWNGAPPVALAICPTRNLLIGSFHPESQIYFNLVQVVSNDAKRWLNCRNIIIEEMRKSKLSLSDTDLQSSPYNTWITKSYTVIE